MLKNNFCVQGARCRFGGVPKSHTHETNGNPNCETNAHSQHTFDSRVRRSTLDRVPISFSEKKIRHLPTHFPPNGSAIRKIADMSRYEPVGMWVDELHIDLLK